MKNLVLNKNNQHTKYTLSNLIITCKYCASLFDLHTSIDKENSS